MHIDDIYLMPECQWVGQVWVTPFCWSTNDCPKNTKEIGRMREGTSRIANFGQPCVQSHKVLCCEEKVIGLDPAENCHLFTSIDGKGNCMFGKELVATESKSVSMIGRHHTMICCNPGTIKFKKQPWEI